jgi:hypothetical protein
MDFGDNKYNLIGGIMKWIWILLELGEMISSKIAKDPKPFASKP